MVIQSEQEMVSPGEEEEEEEEEEVEVVESSSTLLQLPEGQHQPNKDLTHHRHRHRHPLPSLGLGRQSSIYSLTFDEFQHTLSESGRNFGSMNMDEFLASICTAEENQNQNQSTNNTNICSISNPNQASSYEVGGPHDPKGISKQPSLPRQGSLTLPARLCRKTVDEVWSEIHGNGHGQGNDVHAGGGNVQNPESAHRQPTFGEMTLEDFLIKAGVVREQQCAFPPMPAQQKLLGFYQGGNRSANSSASLAFASRSIAGMATGGGVGVGYPQPAKAGVYGGRVGNGGGSEYIAMDGIVGPLSPVLNSEGIVAGGGGIDGAGNQYGMDMEGSRGRKRIIDVPVERVVERRQRRMIKNRESAARSRARKQAYTVELEAELNQLKEENKQLKQALAELENKRKQQCFEQMRMKTRTTAQMDKERLRMIRRNLSCPL